MTRPLLAVWSVLRNNRILHALSWTSAGTALVSVILFGRSVVLARLLSPSDYGIMGLASVVITAIATLTSFGLTSSIIPRDLGEGANVAEILDTVWTAELFRQVLIMVLLLGCAYPSAKYLGDTRVFPVLMVIALAPAIQGFSNIGMVLLQKNVQFRNVMLLRISSELLTTLALVLLAYYLRNVFALAVGQLLSTVISVILSYRFHPYRPHLRFKWEALRGSLLFTRSMLIISVLTYITTQLDNLVVGKYLGPTILGAYLLAYRLCNLPVDMVGDVVGNVLFPVFARAHTTSQRENGEKLLRHTVTISLAFFASLFLSLHLLSADVIRLLYGGKWASAAPMVSLLAFQGLLRGATRTFTPFLLGINRADLDAKAKGMEVIVFIPTLLLLVPRLGASGAAYAGIASYFVAAISRFAFTARLVQNASLLVRPVLQLIGLIIVSYSVSRFLSMLPVPALVPAGMVTILIAISFLVVQGGRIRDTIRIFRERQPVEG